MCAQWKVRLCSSAQVLLMFSTFCVVRGFNVDTENFIKHSGEPGSMFGFSVAEHKERGSNWLLIGAPEAQTPQPGVKRGGAVYRCDISRDDYCQQIPFDRTGHNNDSKLQQLDNKSYQWFGATVRSSGENGVIVACAPRYTWFTHRLNRKDPVGTCFVAKNQMSEFSEFSPCRTRNWGYHKQGSCQAGLGASISKDGRRLFLGAVGSWYWQGQIYSCDSYARLPRPLPPRLNYINEEGQVISQSLYSRPDVISSEEGPAKDDDSYLGYSVAAGDFSGGSGSQSDVAVGMPRGAGLLGKIVLYTWNMTNLQNITGEQMGAYFGYSLAAVDMDGDKLDDLVIGAPLYTDLSNNEGHYENGRVYVVYQGTGEQKFRSMNARDGVNSKARFGLSLASLGDINKDGFGDVAIGAPYDGPQERGFVYIYHGSATGIREKPSQVIRPEDIGLSLTTFGFSLSGGVDMDENQYPDLIVGAYDSDTAVFLKARPVVKMMASVSFLSNQKQVVLEEQNCTLKDGTRVACLSLKMCLEYSGLGVDPRLDFDVQLILDAKKQKSPRMSLLSQEGQSFQNQTITLDKGLQRCQEVFVYIKPGIRDKLTVLEAEMRYGLRVGELQWSTTRRRYQRGLTPVLDLNEPLSRKDSISIQKNCGRDNVCIPNLRIIATPSVKRYLLGSGERLFVDVVVTNEGEDAFESTFDMKVPSGVNYVNIERMDRERDVFVQCSAPSFVNNNTLHCDIGNPLPKEKTVHFKVILQPFHKQGMKPRYEFAIAVNSTNPENETSSHDNLQHLVVHIWVETDLILQGSSHPAMIHYNSTLYSDEENLTQESEIGPQVVHIYSIRNKGPSDIMEADVHFLWPTSTLAHDNLLYLLEQPETSGPIKCERAPNVNPLKLTLERKRASYLDVSGVQSALTGSTSLSSSSSSSTDGATFEESSSSSSSYSSSSSSSRRGSSSTSRGKKVTTTSLTEEEKRQLEDAERRDKEEAATETGDGSQRHRQRIHSSSTDTTYVGSGSSQGSAASQGSSSTSYRGGSYEETSKIGGGGIRIEGGSYGGREGQGTLITERGRVEISGAGMSSGGGHFDTYNTFDGDRRISGGYRVSQSSSKGSSNIEPGIQIGANRDRYGIDERTQKIDQSRGRTETQYTGQTFGGRRGGGSESSSRRNQSYGSSSGDNSPLNVGGRQNRTFSREEHRSSNTSWDSETGGRPITHTSSSWRENENGSVRGGSSSNRAEATTINVGGLVGSGGLGLDRAESRGGQNKTFSREEHRSSNTTWNSETGGKPITHTASSWRENENGVVRGGSSSNRQEATNKNIGDLAGRENFGSGRAESIGGHVSGSSISRQYESEYEQRSRSESILGGGYVTSGTHSSGSGNGRRQGNYGSASGQGSRGYESTSEVSSGTAYDSQRAHGNTGESSRSSNSDSKIMYDSRGLASTSGSTGYDVNSRNTFDSRGSSASSGSSAFDSRRQYEATAGSSGSTGYDSRTGFNTHSGSSQFDALAGIAAGPRDGVARTYTFDVNTDNNRGVSGGGSQHGTISEIAGGATRNTNLRAQGYGIDGSNIYNTGNQFGNSSSSSHRSSWSSSGGGKHYVSGAWNSEENDNVEATREKGHRYQVGRDNVDYDDNDRRGGSSWRSSSSWETKNVRHEEQPQQLSRQMRIRNSDPVTGDNVVETDEPGLQQKFKLYERYRRQLDEEEDTLEDIDCGPIECTRIRCTIGPLSKDQEVWVAFRSRVWLKTLKKFAHNPEVRLSSLVAGRVTRLPHIGAPDQSAIHTHEVLTQVVPLETGTKPDVVPLWVVVLSACAGALILMLLVYLLYKCGFFKRNRPSSNVPEKQPLNRNGHYQSGDEAL